MLHSGAKQKTEISTKNRIDKIKLNSEKDKEELERIRRWKVHIKEIYLTPLDKEEIIDGFLQITVGGDYEVNIYDIPKKEKKIKEITGKRGYTDFTEVIEDMKPLEKIRLFKEIDIEVRDSIVSLMKQNIIIELWDWNAWEFNELLGIHMFNIMNIIKGSINQSCIIKKKDANGVLSDLCRIEFKCIFQEIWDFILSFEDWSATNTNTLFDKKDDIASLNLNVEFAFAKNRYDKITAKNSKKGTINPEWSSFTSDLKYRGTLFDLENQILTISVTNTESLLSIVKKEVKTDLVGITEDGLIRQYFVKTSTAKMQTSSHKGKKTKNLAEEEPDSSIQGKIVSNEIPEFKQHGNESNIQEGEVYLCVYLSRLSLAALPRFVKKPKRVFLILEWSDKMYETERIDISRNNKNFDQNVYFMMDLGAKEIEKMSLDIREEALKSCISLNNEVTVSLMLEDEYKCHDYIGRFSVDVVSIIEKGKPLDKKYKKDDNNEIVYTPKVYKNINRFDSAYLSRELTLEMEMWFYPEELLRKVELTNDSLKKKSTVDYILTKIDKTLSFTANYINEMIANIERKYIDINSRFFKFEPKELTINGEELSNQSGFYVKDQDNNERLLNSYLGKLTIRETMLDEVFLQTNVNLMMQKKSEMEKLNLPILYPISLLHYVRNMRYHSNQMENVILSPHLVMQNRKATKFEIAIYLACLMLNSIEKYNNIDPYSISDTMDLKELFNKETNSKSKGKSKIKKIEEKYASEIIKKANNIFDEDDNNNEVNYSNNNSAIKEIDDDDKSKSQVGLIKTSQNNLTDTSKVNTNFYHEREVTYTNNNTIISDTGFPRIKFKKRMKNENKTISNYNTTNINRENDDNVSNNSKVLNKNNKEETNIDQSSLSKTKRDESILNVTDRRLLDKSINQFVDQNDMLIKENNAKINDISINPNKEFTLLDQIKKQREEKEKLDLERKEKLNKALKKDTKNDLTNFDSSCLVFVCMGTLKIPGNPKHMWVMTIDHNFNDITFWEPTNRKSYKLKKRIEHPIILEKYFKNKYNREEEIAKDIKFLETKDKPLKKQEKKASPKNQKNKLTKVIDETEEVHKDIIQENPYDMLISMDRNENYMNLKNKTSYNQRSNSQNELVTSETTNLINNNENYLDEQLHKILNLQKKNRKLEEKENRSNNIKPSEFYWENEFGLDSKNMVLPYRTIDTIFSKKNIYINNQYPDPAGIVYDIYNKEKWIALLKNYNNLDKIEKNEDIGEASTIWHQDIPVFHSFRNFYNPYSYEEIANMKKSILKSLYYGIQTCRAQKNFQTTFKKQREIIEIIDLYLILLEMKDLGIQRDKHYEKIKNWRRLLQNKMGKERITFLPIHFNYTNDDLIQKFIVENCSGYLQNSIKNITFIVSCKIFQYPNRVLSVRVILCTLYKISEEDSKDECEPLIFQTDCMNMYEFEKYNEELIMMNKTNKTTKA